MSKLNVEINDVVQIIPSHEWSGCFVIVTEVKKWGIQGFVQVPMKSQAYIRIKNGEFEKVGKAIFVLNEE